MTAFRDYLSVCEELIGREPEILEMVNSDLTVKQRTRRKIDLKTMSGRRDTQKYFPGL